MAPWRPAGPPRPHAGLTFEVICRVVFGVTDPERVKRLRTALVAVIDSHPIYMVSGRRAPTSVR